MMQIGKKILLTLVIFHTFFTPTLLSARRPFTQQRLLPTILEDKKIIKQSPVLGEFQSLEMSENQTGSGYFGTYPVSIKTKNCELSGDLKISDKCPFGSAIPFLGSAVLAPAGSCDYALRFKLKKNSCQKVKIMPLKEGDKSWEQSVEELKSLWSNLPFFVIDLRSSSFHISQESVETNCKDFARCKLYFGLIRKVRRLENQDQYAMTFSRCSLERAGSPKIPYEKIEQASCTIQINVDGHPN
jgi:hypothetical protein